jgi:hypothetical protein
VIITVSEGVLNARGDAGGRRDQMFVPPLPSDKMEGMRNIFKMGEYMEIVVQFSNSTWDGVSFLGDTHFTVIETPQRGRCNVLQNYETMKNTDLCDHCHVVVCVITTEVIQQLVEEYNGGSPSSASEARDYIANPTHGISIVNDLLQNTVVKVKSNLFSLPNCTPLVPPDLYSWSPRNPPPGFGSINQTFPTNEWWLGSYMNFRPCGSIDDFRKYIEPIGSSGSAEPNLFFAGSAACTLVWIPRSQCCLKLACE